MDTWTEEDILQAVELYPQTRGHLLWIWWWTGHLPFLVLLEWKRRSPACFGDKSFQLNEDITQPPLQASESRSRDKPIPLAGTFALK